CPPDQIDPVVAGDIAPPVGAERPGAEADLRAPQVSRAERACPHAGSVVAAAGGSWVRPSRRSGTLRRSEWPPSPLLPGVQCCARCCPPTAGPICLRR